jgi:hypothetical protein
MPRVPFELLKEGGGRDAEDYSVPVHEHAQDRPGGHPQARQA